MFPILKKKLKLYLIGVTSLIIAVIFLLLFALYYHFITLDFENKAEKFQSQITASLNLKLQFIEDTIGIFTHQNNLSDVVNNTPETFFNPNKLFNINTYCPEISSVFISSEGGSSYYPTQSMRRSFSDFISEYNIKERQIGSNACWTYVQKKQTSADSGEADYWLCTLPVFSKEGNRKIAYVTAIINRNINSFFQNSNQRFFDGNAYFLSTGDYTAPIYIKGHSPDYNDNMFYIATEQEILDAAKTPGVHRLGKTTIYCSALSEENFRLVTCVKSTYLRSLFERIGTIIIGVLIFILIICAGIAVLITNFLIKDLCKLKTKVDDYMSTTE